MRVAAPEHHEPSFFRLTPVRPVLSGPFTSGAPARRAIRGSRVVTTFVAGMMLLGLTGPVAAAQTAEKPASPAHASQVPGYYRMQLGQLQITALLDGFLPIPEKTVQGISRQALKAALRREHVPQFTAAPLGTGMQTAVNTFLIRRGERLMLVDTGAGTCFGASSGRLMQTMQQAGIDPETVTDVLITHAHPDHICGLLAAGDTMAFPRATVWLPDGEATYWLDEREMARAPEDIKAVFDMAARSLKPYAKAGRVKRVVPVATVHAVKTAHREGVSNAHESHMHESHAHERAASFGIQRVTERELPPGVTLVSSQGHSPGHGSWLVDGKLLLWGDIVHYHAVQFARPLIHSSFDSVPKEAIASRKRLFAEAAKRDWWVGGAHLPFPGLGHVVPQGRAYRWVRTEFTPLP